MHNQANEYISSSLINISTKKWLNISEAAKYAGVSYNTFMKFRTMGLKICEIDGIKRVSRKEIDRFLENHSF
ncbi:DNA-binding protein [Lysinibacillus sp. B2A1]|nr:DNA-binding protein [Lysinibacillus sp. B2A1]